MLLPYININVTCGWRLPSPMMWALKSGWHLRTFPREEKSLSFETSGIFNTTLNLSHSRRQLHSQSLPSECPHAKRGSFHMLYFLLFMHWREDQRAVMVWFSDHCRGPVTGGLLCFMRAISCFLLALEELLSVQLYFLTSASRFSRISRNIFSQVAHMSTRGGLFDTWILSKNNTLQTEQDCWWLSWLRGWSSSFPTFTATHR
jgi:hypothetical protein